MQDLIMLAIQKIPKRTTNLNQIWPLPYLFSLTNMEPANNLGLATSGESASSGLHESDNDSDPETRGAQRELQKLHKQRKLTTIRAKIEEERCLLDVNAGTIETRGQKSRRPEFYDRSPSRTSMGAEAGTCVNLQHL